MLTQQQMDDLILLARHMARQYASTLGIPHEDLQHDAILALLEARETWDPNRGVPFARYALARVAGAIRKTSSRGRGEDLSLDYLLEAGIEPALQGVDWSHAVEAREVITQWLESHWAIVQELQEDLEGLAARLTEAWLESQYQVRLAGGRRREGEVWGVTEGPGTDGMFPSECREDPPWLERPRATLPISFRRKVWKWAAKAPPDILTHLEAASVSRKARGSVIELVRIISELLGDIESEEEEFAARQAICWFVAGVLARRGFDKRRVYETMSLLLRLDEFWPEPAEPESEADWTPPTSRAAVAAALQRVTNEMPPWHRAAIEALVQGGTPSEARDISRAAYERWHEVNILGFPPGARKMNVDRVL